MILDRGFGHRTIETGEISDVEDSLQRGPSIETVWEGITFYAALQMHSPLVHANESPGRLQEKDEPDNIAHNGCCVSNEGGRMKVFGLEMLELLLHV